MKRFVCVFTAVVAVMTSAVIEAKPLFGNDADSNSEDLNFRFRIGESVVAILGKKGHH